MFHKGWPSGDGVPQRSRRPGDGPFLFFEERFFYGDDVWEALGKELKGNPVAVWILGRRLEKSSLVSLSFVLRDGRGLRTKDDHQALKQQCKRLA